MSVDLFLLNYILSIFGFEMSILFLSFPTFAQ